MADQECTHTARYPELIDWELTNVCGAGLFLGNGSDSRVQELITSMNGFFETQNQTTVLSQFQIPGDVEGVTIEDVVTLLMRFINGLKDGRRNKAYLWGKAEQAASFVARATEAQKACRGRNKHKAASAVRELVYELPVANRETLKVLTRMLAEVCANHAVNGMTSTDVRVVAPQISWALMTMVDNWTEVFGAQASDAEHGLEEALMRDLVRVKVVK